MVGRCVFAAEHIVRADGNVEGPRHFFIQQGIPAQVRNVGVHTEPQLADDAIFARHFCKAPCDVGVAAAGDLAIYDLQRDIRVFLIIQIECFEEYIAVGSGLDRGNIDLAAGKITVASINIPHPPAQVKMQHTRCARANDHLIDPEEAFRLALAGCAKRIVVNIIRTLHALNIVLRVEAGLCRVGFRRDANLRKAPAFNQPVEKLRYVPAIQRHLFIPDLISKHDWLIGEHVQYGVEFGKQLKIPLVEAAFFGSHEYLPIERARLLQKDGRGALGRDGCDKAICDVPVRILSPKMNEYELSGRNAARLHEPGYCFTFHYFTSIAMMIILLYY